MLLPRKSTPEMSRVWSILAASFCLCAGIAGFVTVRTTAQTTTQATNGMVRSDKAALVKGGTEDNRYRIGPGDVLSITVRKAPELSGLVRVDQRGMIRIPMIPDQVRAACLTESELASQIVSLYLEYKKAPVVDVFVTEFQSRPVAVIGAINSPGQFRLQRQVRLLELLSFAGGPANRAGRSINVIHTGTSLCEEDLSNAREVNGEKLSTYKLTETMKGTGDANPYVQPGDIVSVPDADQVFVIGHVQSPQTIPLRDKPISISRAIAICGGPARDAKSNHIRIIRQADNSEQKQELYVDLQAVLKQKAPDIILLPNDIVEVPSSTGKVILGALTGAIAPTLTQLPVRAIP